MGTCQSPITAILPQLHQINYEEKSTSQICHESCKRDWLLKERRRFVHKLYVRAGELANELAHTGSNLHRSHYPHGKFAAFLNP